jgi:hypothetical protein
MANATLYLIEGRIDQVPLCKNNDVPIPLIDRGLERIGVADIYLSPPTVPVTANNLAVDRRLDCEYVGLPQEIPEDERCPSTCGSAIAIARLSVNFVNDPVKIVSDKSHQLRQLGRTSPNDGHLMKSHGCSPAMLVDWSLQDQQRSTW